MDTLPQEIIHMIAYWITNKKIFSIVIKNSYATVLIYRLINRAFCAAIDDIYFINEIKYSMKNHFELDKKFTTREHYGTIATINNIDVTQKIQQKMAAYNFAHGDFYLDTVAGAFSCLKNNDSLFLSYKNLIYIYFNYSISSFNQDNGYKITTLLPIGFNELHELCSKYAKITSNEIIPNSVILTICDLLNDISMYKNKNNRMIAYLCDCKIIDNISLYIKIF